MYCHFDIYRLFYTVCPAKKRIVTIFICITYLTKNIRIIIIRKIYLREEEVKCIRNEFGIYWLAVH